MIKREIEEALKNLLEEHNYNHVNAAKALGVAISTFYRWWDGVTPSPSNLIKLGLTYSSGRTTSVSGIKVANNSDRARISGIIRALRMACGLSMLHVRTILAIHGRTMSNYESGYSKIPANMLEKFAEIYGVTVDYITKSNLDDVIKDCSDGKYGKIKRKYEEPEARQRMVTTEAIQKVIDKLLDKYSGDRDKVAKHLGASISTLNRWIAGTSYPNNGSLLRLRPHIAGMTNIPTPVLRNDSDRLRIATIVKILRTSYGLSQDDAADGLGVTKMRFVRYEWGHIRIPKHVLEQMAELYDVSYDYIMKSDIDSVIKKCRYGMIPGDFYGDPVYPRPETDEVAKIDEVPALAKLIANDTISGTYYTANKERKYTKVKDFIINIRNTEDNDTDQRETSVLVHSIKNLLEKPGTRINLSYEMHHGSNELIKAEAGDYAWDLNIYRVEVIITNQSIMDYYGKTGKVTNIFSVDTSFYANGSSNYFHYFMTNIDASININPDAYLGAGIKASDIHIDKPASITYDLDGNSIITIEGRYSHCYTRFLEGILRDLIETADKEDID